MGSARQDCWDQHPSGPERAQRRNPSSCWRQQLGKQTTSRRGLLGGRLARVRVPLALGVPSFPKLWSTNSSRTAGTITAREDCSTLPSSGYRSLFSLTHIHSRFVGLVLGRSQSHCRHLQRGSVHFKLVSKPCAAIPLRFPRF